MLWIAPTAIALGYFLPPLVETLLGHLLVIAAAVQCRPAVLELTDGKPQLREGVLIYEDWDHNTPTGGRLHSAREDWGHDSARFEVRDGRILCDQFLTFTYLDDVLPGDGGLACTTPPTRPSH